MRRLNLKIHRHCATVADKECLPDNSYFNIGQRSGPFATQTSDNTPTSLILLLSSLYKFNTTTFVHTDQDHALPCQPCCVWYVAESPFPLSSTLIKI